VPLLPASTQLSHVQKDALIAALTARLVTADERIAAQDARIAALEARLDELTRPPKTPDNSSKPPSQGQKEDRPASGTDRPARKSRPGGSVRARASQYNPVAGWVTVFGQAAPNRCNTVAV
jgi:transposase